MHRLILHWKIFLAWVLLFKLLSSESTDELTTQILKKQASPGGKSALLVGISGIDASGKGNSCSELKLQLSKSGMHVAKLPQLMIGYILFLGSNSNWWCFDFIRKDFVIPELFQQLILPLKNKQSVRLQSFKTHLISAWVIPHTWHFVNTDIILLEGIFYSEKPGEIILIIKSGSIVLRKQLCQEHWSETRRIVRRSVEEKLCFHLFPGPGNSLCAGSSKKSGWIHWFRMIPGRKNINSTPSNCTRLCFAE